MILALALYVYDAGLMLPSDEFVLVRKGHGHWKPRFGANGWKLAGREPFLPNLLTPWRPMVRVQWAFEDGLQGPRSPGGVVLPSINAWPCVAAGALLLLIFAALPICLFLYPVTVFTLSVVALIYGNCILTLALIYAQRASLGMTTAQFMKLAGECVSCPPFCVNAIRKASLHAPATVTLSDVAASLQRDEDRESLRRQLEVRIREQIETEAEGTLRMERLLRVRDDLAKVDVE